MSAPPERGNVVRQWIQKAENDLLNAEHTLTLAERCPFDTICFHAQQCAEKYLKALLVYHEVPFPKTHDLILLKGLAPEATMMDVPLSQLSVLNRYSVEVRYPFEIAEISRREAERAVAIAKEVRRAVLANLSEMAFKN